MANKALATRQKLRLTVAPSQHYGKPRNPVAVAAKRLLAKARLKPDPEDV